MSSAFLLLFLFLLFHLVFLFLAAARQRGHCLSQQAVVEEDL
jgi:hypothetical protein